MNDIQSRYPAPSAPLIEQPGELGDALRETHAALAASGDQRAAWRRLEERLERQRARVRLLPALALLPIAAIILLFVWGPRKAPPANPLLAPSSQASPAGGFVATSSEATLEHTLDKPGRAELPDGSSLTVSSGAARWRAAKDGVRVHLQQGKLRCAVAKQPSEKRFIVEAAGYSFVVLGTEFEVSRSGQESRLEVFSGRVEVRRGAQRLAIISAGEIWSAPHSTDVDASAQPAESEASADLVTKRAAPEEPAPDSALQPEDCGALVKQQNLRPAVECYQKQAQGSGLAAEVALFELARLQASALGNPAAAVQTLEQHRARFPSGALTNQVRLALAKALAATGRLEAAASTLTPLIARGGAKASELRLLRANIYRQQGSCSRALSDYEAVIASGVFVAEAERGKAQCAAEPANKQPSVTGGE